MIFFILLRKNDNSFNFKVPAGPITRSRASREKIRKMDTMDELKEWAAAN